MKIQSPNTVVLCVLAILFLAPGLAAIYFYQHPERLNWHTTNKGALLKPPMRIASLLKSRAHARKEEPQWHLLLWTETGCDEACMEPLKQLRRVRIALGRHFYEVDEAVMTGPFSHPMPSSLLEFMHQHALDVVHLPRNEASRVLAYADDMRIFIANQAGFLVLSYAATVDPDDVYHDLKQLLTTTQTPS